MAPDFRLHRPLSSAAPLQAGGLAAADAPWPAWLRQTQHMGRQLAGEGAGLQPLLHDPSYAAETAARARAQILLDAGAALLRAGTGGGP